MAQILIWRRGAVKASLDNIKPGQMLFFSDAELRVRAEYYDVSSRVAYAAHAAELSPSTEKELQAAELDFRAKDGSKRFVRGKYLIWFLVESLTALHAATPKFCARHSKPPKARVTVGVRNAMSVIGPRAKAPPSLIEFLRRGYGAYAGNSETL